MAGAPETTFRSRSGLCANTEVLLNWLLSGLSGRGLLNAPLNSKFEDCIICIQAHRSVVFCKRDVHAEVVARTAAWESCEVINTTRDEEADSDVYDAKVIGVFMNMVDDCSSIGVALRESDLAGLDAKPDSSRSDDIKMALERWPLIQAYAYDDYGRGFLTLSKQIVNIETSLAQRAYTLWDLPSVMEVMTSLSSSLQRAWDEAMLLQDKHGLSGRREAQTSLVEGPLVDFFEYGRLTVSDDDVLEVQGLQADATPSCGSMALPQPRVLLGSSSAQIVGGNVGQEAVPDSSPLHAIWEAVEPVSGLAATRTIAMGALLRGGSQDLQCQRCHALLRAYGAAEACFRSLAAQPALFTTAGSDLGRAAQSCVQTSFPEVRGAIHATHVTVDALGMQSQCRGGVQLVFLRVAIANLTCPSTGEALGAVAYGDTFFIAQPSPVAPLAGGPALMAERLPAFAFWPSHEDVAIAEKVQMGLNSALGIGIPEGPYVALGHRPDLRVPVGPRPTFPDPLLLGTAVEKDFRSSLALNIAGPGARPVVGNAQGSGWAFASGKVVFCSPRSGHIVLEVLCDSRGLRSSDAGSGLLWVPARLLRVELDGSLAESTAGSLCGMLAVAVTPGVIAAWRANLQAPVQELEDGMLDLQWLAYASEAAASRGQLLDMVALTAAHTGNMPNTTLELAFNEPSAMRPVSAAACASCRCIWLTGLPGCGVIDMAVALCMAVDAGLVDTCEALGDEAFGAGVFAADVPRVIPALVQRMQAKAAHHSTLVVCDTMFPVAEVLNALRCTDSFSAQFSIAHVVSIVEPLVAYPWNTARHPLLLSRVHRGWVSTVTVQDTRHLADAGTSSSSSTREWGLLADRLLKELHALRGQAAVLRQPSVSGLVDSLQPESISSSALQSLALPGAFDPGYSSKAGVSPFCVPSSALVGLFVPLTVPLDVDTLQLQCAACLEAAVKAANPAAGKLTASPRWKGLFCIEAHVRGAAGQDLWLDLQSARQRLADGSALADFSVVMTARGNATPPRHWAYPLNQPSGMMWWFAGRAVEATALRSEIDAVLASCRLVPPAEMPLRTPDGLSPGEMAALEESAARQGLPEGCFFDGTHYMNADGLE
eukprot:CAMPEP_0178400658 /NCGR_PEP_ID=MMETSP0689_2-20121128/15902_1 /TAXON_ID=160604 /ORGANISM="Amphidinium massartii, Strain CS-259" /LENGTH=1106 /DNA_ID=CAMNT_0020021459 /DNA_START=57 /DNA_END=3374 /DNA_ORIENTATION=+